jgi:hypothetical protein
LLYGRPGLAAPTYDIALLAPADSPPGATSTAAAGRIPQVVFWAVLGLAVLAMVGLIARLLKGANLGTEPAAGSG